MNIDFSHLESIVTLTNPDQIGMVVEDVDAAAKSFAKILGANPIEVIDWPIPGVDPEAFYYGKPAQWKMRVCFFQIGNMQWELVQPLEGQSIFSDFLKEHGPVIFSRMSPSGSKSNGYSTVSSMVMAFALARTSASLPHIE